MVFIYFLSTYKTFVSPVKAAYMYEIEVLDKKWIKERAHGIRVILVGNGYNDPSSNPDVVVSISHWANSVGKGMNPSILPSVMGK